MTCLIVDVADEAPELEQLTREEADDDDRDSVVEGEAELPPPPPGAVADVATVAVGDMLDDSRSLKEGECLKH